MSASDEAVVRRFYEQMNNERKNELAAELFTADHRMHDPQVPPGRARRHGRHRVRLPDRASTATGGSRRSSRPATGSSCAGPGPATHVGEVNGIPPTGKKIAVDAISIHRMAGGKIAETWEVWDTLGFLQQVGVVPAP